MPLTQHSHVFGQVNESAFNRILREVRLQRPEIFNYATARVAATNSFCTPIEIDSVLQTRNPQRFTEMDKIPIAGSSDPSQGLDYCLQLKDLILDFSPVNSITLPAELGSLNLQEFAIKATICAGISCGQQMIQIPMPEAILTGKIKSKAITKGLRFFPMRRLQMQCFCLSVYLKAVLVQEQGFLKLKLSGIEIEDIAPLGLENAIECYLKNVLDLSVFPKLKIALSDLIFDVQGYLTIQPTPIGGSVPNNPKIENNSVSIYLNIN